MRRAIAFGIITAVLAAFTVVWPAVLLPQLEQLPTDFDANSSYPVSYTPLRAHETVLDLVCRLLLEKKKNIYP